MVGRDQPDGPHEIESQKGTPMTLTAPITAQISAMKTRMKVPVICAPMFLISGPEMVINACKSGVMGSFPATNARTEKDLRVWIEEISSSVTALDAPWALNMITHSSYGRFEAERDLVAEFQPALVITALGGPHRIVDTVHDYGGLVFADVNSPKYAKKAVEKGPMGLCWSAPARGGTQGNTQCCLLLMRCASFLMGP